MRILLLLGVVAYYATSSNAAIVNGLPNFANNFLKAVAENESGNMICSPISADVLLTLMSFGARTRTQKQLLSVLESNGDTSLDRTLNFLGQLDGFKEVELRMANNVFLSDGFSLNPDFKYVMMLYYITPIASINFRNTVKASKIINDWTAKNTNNRIKELVTPDTLSVDTSAVLVNAIYFKGNWLYKFDAEETKPRPFHVNGISKDVPTMHLLGGIGYGTLPEIEASYVELPYTSKSESQDISMYIILPDKVDGFEKLKNNLEKITVKQLNENSNWDRVVDLYLPKFKIESTLNLEAPLVKMGLTDMFSGAADFRGILQHSRLNKVKAIQKAFIEVNEEGTEAAAATGIELVNKFGEEDPEPQSIVKFVADRPFVSIIATKSGVALFGALTVDPHTE